MGKVIVITGGSGGIGAATARLAAKKGHRVVLAARREKELADVAKDCPGSVVVRTDVTKKDEVERLAKKAIDACGHVDTWVNNAGRGIMKSVLEIDDADIDAMVRDNVKSVIYGVHAILPCFVARGAGHIVNVSSMLGRIPYVPFRSAYSGAKHMLNALTANLRMELRAKHPGIAVTLVMPGVVSTDFAQNALHAPEGFQLGAMPFVQTPEQVAEVLMDVIEHPRAEAYTAPHAQGMVERYYHDVDAAEREMAQPRR